jgi:sensor histidine kinase YesM
LLKHYTHILFFICCWQICQGQSSIGFKELNTSNGLTANKIYNIHKAKNGLLYIAHSKGLSSYDGVQVRYLYNSSLPYSELTNIMEAEDGTILAEGFYNTIFQLNKNDSITRVTNFEEQSFYTPSSIKASGVYHLHKDSLANYNVQTSSRTCKPLIRAKAIATKDVVCYCSYKQEIIKIDSSGNFEQIGAGAFHVHDTNLFIINMTNSILWYNKNYSFKFNAKLNERINYIQCIDDVVCVLTNMGLYQLSNDKFYPVLLGQNATAISHINKQYFIMSTLDKGLVLVKNKQNKQLNTGSPKITVIHKVKDTIYLGKENGEIQQITPKTNRTRQYKLTSVAKIFDDGSRTLYSQNLIINKKEIVNLLLLDVCPFGKHLLLATNARIFLMPNKKEEINNRVFLPTKVSPSLLQCNLLQQRTSSLEYDSVRKIIYVSNFSGLFTIDSNFIVKQMPEPYCVFAEILIYDNELLLLTKDQGVLMYKDGKYSKAFSHLKIPSFISDGQVHGKALWLKTEEGLIRIQDNKMSTYNNALNVSPLNIDEFWADDSTLLYSSKNILYQLPLIINSSEVANNKCYLNFIKANNKLISNYAILPTKQNTIEIGFSILNFEQAEDVYASYTINDGDTVSLSFSGRSIKLSQLQSGNYNIKLLLHTSSGVSIAHTINFTIKAPFYKTGWFLGLLGLMALVLVFAFYNYRLRKINKSFADREARFMLERELDSSILKSIRTQMNPHFLYNALNTIQSYVYMNDVQSAGLYISKFSDLTRTILKQSEKNTISIAEEINGLNLYLELEKMRFEDILHYEIICDAHIIKEEAQVPPLLLQPYVENAIKHGLFHKQENRRLVIKFEQQEENIIITIDDNGVGREKSAEINANRAKFHQSFSMDANKKRIEILKQYYPEIQFKIIDKKTNLGEPLGTSIIITLPLELH